MNYMRLTKKTMSIDNIPLYHGQTSNIIQPSESGEAIKSLNDTSIDNNGMSAIDLRTRLSSHEVSTIMALDVLIALGAYPNETIQLTMQRKRLAVSLKGEGRNEIVRISQGLQEQKKQGFFSHMFRGEQ